MKKLILLLATLSLAVIAQAPPATVCNYSVNNGMTCQNDNGQPTVVNPTQYTGAVPGLLYVSQQTGTGWNMSGVVATGLIAKGRNGIDANVSFLKPDGTTGTLEVVGGLIVSVQ